MELQNTSSERRHWTSLQTADGRTLVLDPGEVGDVAVDEAPDDPWLKPAKGVRGAKGRNPRPGGAKAGSGPEDVPEGTSKTSGEGSPPNPPIEPEPATELEA